MPSRTRTKRERACACVEDAKPKNPRDVEYDFDTSGTLNVPGDWNSQRPELFFVGGREYREQPLPAYLITQDIQQIVQEYGVNESNRKQLRYTCRLHAEPVRNLELLCKMTGTETIQKAAFSYSGSRGSTILNHINGSVRQIQAH